jgi:hypothetical protein
MSYMSARIGCGRWGLRVRVGAYNLMTPIKVEKTKDGGVARMIWLWLVSEALSMRIEGQCCQLVGLVEVPPDGARVRPAGNYFGAGAKRRFPVKSDEISRARTATSGRIGLWGSGVRGSILCRISAIRIGAK